MPGSAPAAEKYGAARLGALYEISKLLTKNTETTEQTVLELLGVVTKQVPLRSAVLIEKIGAQPKAVVWHAPDASPADLLSAEARARGSFEFLSGSPAPPAAAVDAGALPPTGDMPPRRPERGKFITTPLIIHGHPVLGVLHLEGVETFDEADVEFVSAIANQLAIALDRYQGRLHEIALRRQAEEHDKFKTGLVSVVSHEVANSLAVMKMAAFLLQEKIPAEYLNESGRLFGMILTNIDALNLATKNLLNMGRLEAGKLAIDFAPIDAAQVLRGVVKTLGLLIEQKALRLVLELPDGPALVRADQPSLTLVFSNLLNNAIKYTPAHGEIVLGIAAEGSRPGFRRVYVQDSGIGVSEEDRAKILGGHFRAESGKQMTSRGFGVGLSLAQQIVEAHDSTIEIEGAPGKGSRFSFLLPEA